MKLKQTHLHILHQAKDLSGEAKTGVSLHCHTEHSKEMLDFIPHYADKIPIVNYFWRKERDKYLEREGKGIDFSTAFWQPPLSAQNVYDIETEQINNAGLEAIASITDHDSIDANLKVCEATDIEKAPISLEWTVPFSYGFFHVGVHNLPEERAEELTKTLLDYTFNEENHSDEHLHQMFTMLEEIPGVLIVLNHPIWDIELVGKERHEELLKDFLKEHGRHIHAFEINGFRSWSENKAVIEMAEALGFPLVTGGDRHGCKPNTVVNLTNSKTFSEFVEEIRIDKRSTVVLMPEYRQPLYSRQMQSFSEILSFYPEYPEGQQRWFDRVHFDIGDGKGLVPLSDHGWRKGGPLWLRWAIKTLGFFGSPKMRPVIEITRKRKDRVPKHIDETKLEIPDLEEVANALTAQNPPASTDSAF